MSVLDDVEAAQQAISRMRENGGAHGGALRAEVMERLQKLHAKIVRMPPTGNVRTAIIAVNNLLVSLRRAGTQGGSGLVEELESAHDTLGELLGDPELGFTPQELRRRIDDALLAKGITTCLACGNPDFDIEAGYVLIRPYPSDPGVPPSQVPSAFLVCNRCGHSWTHDLRKLGVVEARRSQTSS